MKIPAVAHNADSGTYWPRLVMPQYRATQGVKTPAMGTNQCRSNNGYKGGVLSPAFWKVTLNSVPSFYSGIASISEAVVHEIGLDHDVDMWPILNKETPAVEANPSHVPPIAAFPAVPAYWMNVYVDDYYEGYLPYTDCLYGLSNRAIYANYTPYMPQPNRTAVQENVADNRNPDYVTTTSTDTVMTLHVIPLGDNWDRFFVIDDYESNPHIGHIALPGWKVGDVITFSCGTALYTGSNTLRVLTDTGFQHAHTYDQTDKPVGAWDGTGMVALATCPTGVNNFELVGTRVENLVHGDVCGKGFTPNDVITFSAGTANVVGIQTVYQTTGVLLQSDTALTVLTSTWVKENYATSGWRDGQTYDQTETTGTGTYGKVLATATGFLRYDIVDGGQDYAVGDLVTISDVNGDSTIFGGFIISEVDGDGAIVAITGVDTEHPGSVPYSGLYYEHTYLLEWAVAKPRAWVYSEILSGPSLGTGAQVYVHPVYALTPQPSTNIIIADNSYYSCGTNYQVGDIVHFGDATFVVTSITSPEKWNVTWGDPYGWKYYGPITGLQFIDPGGLVDSTTYTATSVTGGNDQVYYHNTAGYPGANWSGSGQGSGAQIKAHSPCTICRVGWPRYNVGIRSMGTVYGQANPAPGRLQIAVGLHIPFFSDRYSDNSGARLGTGWYPEGEAYLAWGMEIDAEMWPDVMKLESLTLPFVGLVGAYWTKYKNGNYGYDGAANWNGTTITLTRTQKPTDNYPGRPYCLFPWALQIT